MEHAYMIYTEFIKQGDWPHWFTPSAELQEAGEAFRDTMATGSGAEQEKQAVSFQRALRKFLSRGVRVSVLRSAHGDCTNRGVTSRHATVFLVGKDVPRTNEIPEGDERVLLLHERPNMAPVARPLSAGNKWTMAGGNFVYSCCSTWRKFIGHPISVHDRIE